MNAPITAEEVRARNLQFLRAKNSDSEDEVEDSKASKVQELSPEDLAFLYSLSRGSFSAENVVTRLTALIHEKLELISQRTDAQVALEGALKAFTKAYWPCLMSNDRLANPINDLFKSVMYYKDRRDLVWIGALVQRLDFERRFELVGIELGVISEQHQIEIEIRRTAEKREKQRKKEEEKRLKFLPVLKEDRTPPPAIEIPQVSFSSVFGEDVQLADPSTFYPEQ